MKMQKYAAKLCTLFEKFAFFSFMGNSTKIRTKLKKNITTK